MYDPAILMVIKHVLVVFYPTVQIPSIAKTYFQWSHTVCHHCGWYHGAMCHAVWTIVWCSNCCLLWLNRNLAITACRNNCLSGSKTRWLGAFLTWRLMNPTLTLSCTPWTRSSTKRLGTTISLQILRISTPSQLSQSASATQGLTR